MATTFVQRRNPVVYPLSTRRETGFSHWSRHEPIRAQRTDHWSKLRTKSYQLTQVPTGHYISFCKPSESHILWNYTRQRFPKPATLARVGSPEFNKYIVERLHNPCTVKPRPPSGYNRHARVPSASSQRAKRGHRYWPREAKPAPPGSKATMGSKGSYLGIGIPRL